MGAARDTFAHAGYHATAMDDIAERAGVSKPVLYQHFTSKIELYLALLDQQVETLVTLIHSALRSTDDNEQRLAATVEAYFEFVDTPEGAYRLVFESDFVAEPDVKNRVESVTDLCASAIGEVVSEDTGLDKDEAFLIGVCLAGSAQACAARWVALGRAVPRDRAAALVTSLGWRGLTSLPLTRDEVHALGSD
ncbi:TetR/AcrR family transcriptional regulator [Ornithinimicrobium sp. Arc0846-15]|nr:TetR/AcrR family transcriptional regulator [Ornithinimicrobium laminariae]